MTNVSGGKRETGGRSLVADRSSVSWFLLACGVLERSRPTGLLGSRHQLPRVFPGGSHETRLP